MVIETEKLQKVLARAGFGSRRTMEEWITEGRISINGKKATLGDRVTSTDKIRVDGHLLNITESHEIKTKILIYNKPEGEICTQRDPEGRPSVFDRLPKLNRGRWVMIGRLDINTQGLLLFTNDGELANQLMHPRYQVEREYAVRVKGEINEGILQRLKTGVMLEDGPAKFTTITDAGGEGTNHWYHVTLNEGRNREVRRLWESQDVLVSRLIRIRYGDISLPRELHRGQYDYLEKTHVEQLLASIAEKESNLKG
jgi:23S rRNA pseudouridine2605 synthase